MTSLERMSCLAEHDSCNSSVPCMDDGCHGFRAVKQLAASSSKALTLNTEPLNLKVDPTP